MWGERISSLGEDHFLWQFRKWVGSNPNHAPAPNSVVLNFNPDDRPSEPLDNFLSIARAVTHPVEHLILLGGFLFCAVATWFAEDKRVFPIVFAVASIFWLIWIGSLFVGFYKYRRWLRGLLEKYRNGPSACPPAPGYNSMAT